MWFKNSKSGRNVYILLDRSGSMSTNWQETLGSINGYVEKLEDDVNVYLAAFDSCGGEDYQVLRETTSKEWRLITNEEVSARGSTPLYDAAAKIMNKMLSDNPQKAVLVVMTDGQENCSKEYRLDAVKAKLKEIEKKEWPAVFLGADFSQVVSYTTTTFGVSSSNAFNTTSAMRGTAMNMMAGKTSTYFTADLGTQASAESMQWSDEEKKLVGGDDSTTIKVNVTKTNTSGSNVRDFVKDTTGHA